MDKLAKYCRAFAIAICGTIFTTTVSAQELEGLYQPKGASWKCTMDSLGSDGGALGIVNGKIEGVESTCALSNAKKAAGGATQYTATCTSEGEFSVDTVEISKTQSGIAVMRNGSKIEWDRCGTISDATAPRWSFDGESAKIVAAGLSFKVGCFAVTGSTAIPNAVFSGHCSDCADNQKVAFTLQVDSRYSEAFVFKKRNNLIGYVSDLGRQGDWREGLVPALMAGNRLKVLENGAEVAEFPLAGSSRALKSLRSACN